MTTSDHESGNAPPIAPNSLSPDGRFIYDGTKWHAVPLPPHPMQPRRRVPPTLVWFLVVIAAMIVGGFIFIAIVTLGLGATNQLPR